MSNADTNIAAMRTSHDRLAALVAELDDDALASPSGASEWDVSQVLSHLGSGAEITRAVVQAAFDGEPPPGPELNQGVWDRWNAMSRRERADGFLRSQQGLVELYEAMDADTRENLRIDVGFLPAPVDAATAVALRLNEMALHSWDVRVTLDPGAVLDPEATGPVLAGLNAMAGWLARPEPVAGKAAVIAVTTTDPASVFALRLGDEIGIEGEVSNDPDGTLRLPAEAWLRLVAGRLAPEHMPASVTAAGAADLDLLRQVFAGF